MLELEQALEKILVTIPAPESETVTLAEADGRFPTEHLIAPIDLPPFDNSSVDGYAVRAADTANATRAHPVRLRLAGRVAAGSNHAHAVGGGECVRLFTGSPVPPGANAVIMQEESILSAGDSGTVAMTASVPPGENIRRQGEDVTKGSVVVEQKKRLAAGHLALLAAVGISQVAVGRRPAVGVVATGSELAEPGQPLGAGRIYESNRLALSLLIRKAGAEAKIYPVVRDELRETHAALLRAFEDCDVLVTSGGVSVGEMDFIKTAFEQAGGDLQFWKVAVKPGRPFVFGRRQQKLLFGLPGNPVSAFVTFLLLVRPALLRWQGAADVSLPCSAGVLAERLVNEGARRHFMRVRVDADSNVHRAGLQASHALSSLAAANGLVEVPAATTFERGSLVRVLQLDGS